MRRIEASAKKHEMKKSYSHYTADDIKSLGLTVSRAKSRLFQEQTVEPSPLL